MYRVTPRARRAAAHTHAAPESSAYATRHTPHITHATSHAHIDFYEHPVVVSQRRIVMRKVCVWMAPRCSFELAHSATVARLHDALFSGGDEAKLYPTIAGMPMHTAQPTMADGS